MGYVMDVLTSQPSLVVIGPFDGLRRERASITKHKTVSFRGNKVYIFGFRSGIKKKSI